MKNLEKTWLPEPMPEEGSGFRKKPLLNKEEQVSLTDEELGQKFRKLDERMENYPSDPFEDAAPVSETDTSKVWGMTEDLDAEDREHAKRLAERLADFDEGSEKKSA